MTRIRHYLWVSHENGFLPPVGFVRRVGEPLPDDEVKRVLVEMCEHGGQHQPPSDLSEEALARLRDGEAARDVANWLLSQLDARSNDEGWWVRVLLDES